MSAIKKIAKGGLAVALIDVGVKLVAATIAVAAATKAVRALADAGHGRKKKK